MPEGLMDPDGTPVPGVEPVGDAEFAEMQIGARAAAGHGQVPPPPKTDPEAPFGRKLDGSPKKTPGGRKPKVREDAPRVQAAGPVGDYTTGLTELGDGLWTIMAVIPVTKAQAALFDANQARLVYAANISAQNNATVRKGIEFLTSEGTWMLLAAMALAPFAMQSFQLWTNPKAMEAQGMSRDELAAATDRKLVRRQEEAAAALREATGVAA